MPDRVPTARPGVPARFSRAGEAARGRRQSIRSRSRGGCRPCTSVPLPPAPRASPRQPRSAASSNARTSTMAPASPRHASVRDPASTSASSLGHTSRRWCKFAAEIGQRLRVARFGPEGAGDPLTRDWSAAGLQNKEGNELLLSRGRRPGRGAPLSENSETAEQLDT